MLPVLYVEPAARGGGHDVQSVSGSGVACNGFVPLYKKNWATHQTDHDSLRKVFFMMLVTGSL